MESVSCELHPYLLYILILHENILFHETFHNHISYSVQNLRSINQICPYEFEVDVEADISGI